MKSFDLCSVYHVELYIRYLLIFFVVTYSDNMNILTFKEAYSVVNSSHRDIC